MSADGGRRLYARSGRSAGGSSFTARWLAQSVCIRSAAATSWCSRAPGSCGEMLAVGKCSRAPGSCGEMLAVGKCSRAPGSLRGCGEMLRGCDAAATAERAVPRTGRSWSRTAGRPNAVGRGTKRRESISPQPAPTSCARRVAAGGATEEPSNKPAIPFVVGEGGSGTLSRRSTARPRCPTRLPSASGDLASGLAK